MDIKKYWEATLSQNYLDMKKFFHPKAYINFHNTNEHFTLEEFLEVNCKYPGKWKGHIERLEVLPNLIITVVKVFSYDNLISHYVTSFIQIKNDKIISIDEYWGENGQPPQWRLEKNIGTNIIF